MRTLSIRRLWTMYADIMFRDKAIASSKGGRIFSRTLAHGAFYAGARSVLQVLAHIKKLDDCFGQFLVRVVCDCGACREIEPEVLARLVGWSMNAQGARTTDAVLATQCVSGKRHGLKQAHARVRARRPCGFADPSPSIQPSADGPVEWIRAWVKDFTRTP